ncbi:ABC transporter permease [Kitasatospora viridis]|uniref:ABC-2 type transport system permease protein n=1 Tax=Kitasatospora viridis TaxID=281105 RepID=A0A561TWK5_9ACTN|nr:ABC transporter permease [Kitasatospora viridis]TWF91496.1 ABC-2 type transport system permease protein [Kitasatospora viridis]
MSHLTHPVPARPTAAPRARAALAAEWIKLRSLRSMVATPLLALLCCVGLAGLVCDSYVVNWPHLDAARKAAFQPLDVNLGFVQIGILFFGVLGALVVTSEYGNGLIRTTFAATPQRGLVLAAKTVLLTAIALVTATVICLTAFLVGQGELFGYTPSTTLGEPGVLGHLVGAVGYLTAAGLIGLFIGVLARSTGVAMSGVFGLLLVLPTMVNNLPRNAVWRHTVPYLPSNLGNALWHSHTGGLVSQSTAALVLPLYPLLLGALAALALRSRDA